MLGGGDSALPPTLKLNWISIGGNAESTCKRACKRYPAHMLGWHLIFSAYGFWLPNDERGSGSSRVRVQHIYEAGGDATKVSTRHSVAHKPHDLRLRRLAKESLKYPA